jgi:hypothetical protein
MMRSSLARGLFALFVLAGASLPAEGGRSFQDFGEGNLTQPSAINAAGVIVGKYQPCPECETYHGFLRATDGTITTFDPPGSQATYPTAISGGGAVAGNYTDKSEVTRGFLRYPGGAFKKFDPPGSVQTMPMSIDRSGKIVGYYYVSGTTTGCGQAAGTVPHAFVRDGDGVITSIDPPGAVVSFAFAINNTGQIVGQYCDSGGLTHGFLRNTDGSFTTIDVPGATTTNGNGGTSATGISSSGEIAGGYTDSSLHSNGFVRATDGTITTFSVAGATYMTVLSMSGAGAVTGWWNNDAGTHGYIRSPAGAITKFDVPGGSSIGTLPSATNGQQITGWYFSGSDTSSGFLMTR